MEEPLVLGLDVGTSRIKALLLDRAGARHGLSSAPTPFSADSQRSEMTLGALHDGLGEVLAGLGPERRRVVAIGIAGVAESGAPLDADRRPLAPIIAWHDPRGKETVALLEAGFGDELPRRIGQRLRPVSSVAKLGWLVHHGAGDVRRWLGVPELCLHRLTGAEVTEHSLAARTGCYDVERHRYLPEVAARAGFGAEVFPPVLVAGRVMGRVSGPASAWSGLPNGAAVTLAGHDHLAGADGCGAGDGDLVNSVGTAETVIGRHRDFPDVDRALPLKAAVTIRPGGEGWATLTSAARSGIVLTRVAEALGSSPGELDRMATEAGAVDAGEVLEQAAAGRPLFLPDGSPGEIWNGLLRALARRTAEAVERASELTGPPARLVVFGGGSRSRPWLEAKARAVAAPVWRSEVSEAVSRGAALRAGMAAGWWESPAEAPAASLQPVSRPTR